MAIAKGSLSVLYAKEQTAAGTAATGNFKVIPFNSEALGQNINRILGEDIRPDRTVPSSRGGNIGPGGNITSDFTLRNYALFFRHLLGGSWANPVSVVIASLAAGTFSRGQLRHSGGRVYQCVQGGTESGSPALTVTDGTEELAGGSIWLYLGPYTTVSAAATNAGDTFALVAHGLADLQVVQIVSGAPTGTTVGQNYWVIRTDADNFQLASSLANAMADTPVVLGSDTTCVLVSSTVYWQHVLDGAQNLPTYGLTMEKGILGGDVSFYERYIDGKINSLQLTVPQEGIVKGAWEVLFNKVLASTTTSNAGTPVSLNEIPVTGFEAACEIAGAETYDLREFTMTITNNMDADAYRVGSRFRKDIPENRREISGTATMYFSDATMVNRFKNETAFVMKPSFYHGGDFMSFEMPVVKMFGDATPKTGGSGVLTSPYEFSAEKSGGATYDIRLTLITSAPTAE
jgi:hypothetical protein